jgi:hypothetical protein
MEGIGSQNELAAAGGTPEIMLQKITRPHGTEQLLQFATATGHFKGPLLHSFN